MDWQKIPFAGRKALLDCIKDTGAEVLVLKGCFFLLSPKINNDQTIEAIKRVFLEGTGDIGELIHTSSQSYRSIYSFREKDENGEVYFIKKICRKSPLYWFHNLFRYASSIRGEIAAERLKAAGIHTPEHLLVGERRNGIFLENEYLVIRFIPAMKTVCDVFMEEDREEMLNEIFTQIGELAARMHLAGVAHRDFHLENIYIHEEGSQDRNSSNSYGICDFLDAIFFAKAIPQKYVYNDVQRMIGNIIKNSCIKKVSPDSYVQSFYDTYKRAMKNHHDSKMDYKIDIDEMVNRLKSSFAKRFNN